MKTVTTVSIADVESLANRAGSHWFESSTMRFFKCRVAQTAQYIPADDVSDDNRDTGTYLFVSSEQGPHDVRRYSVRKVTISRELREDGYNAFRFQVCTDGFQSHETQAKAKSAMKATIKELSGAKVS